MIWKRTVASQMAEARLTMINAEIKVGDGLFKSSGKSIDFPDSLEPMLRVVMTQVLS